MKFWDPLGTQKSQNCASVPYLFVLDHFGSVLIHFGCLKVRICVCVKEKFVPFINERRKVVWLKCYICDISGPCHRSQEDTDNMGMCPPCIFLTACWEETWPPVLSPSAALLLPLCALCENKVLCGSWGSRPAASSLL